MKKIIYNILLCVYAVIAVFITITLLSYNEYKVTELGNYAFIIVNDESLEPDFKKGDLVLVDKSTAKKAVVGQEIFFYVTENKVTSISVAELTKKEAISSTEAAYTVKGDVVLASSSVIGTTNKVTKIPTVGTILGILQSKWGFLFLIVLPLLIAFIYEIGVVFSEVKASKSEAKASKKEN